MKQTMLNELDKRFAGLKCDKIYSVATYLDLRYECKLFSSSQVISQVHTKICRLCDEILTENKINEPDEPPQKRHKII